jgi:glycine cleavage system H protein
MPEIPADLKYSADHLWIRLVDGTSRVRAGVTDFAQQSLGDVVEVTPPRAGDSITTGTVRDRNDDLAETPEVVNSDPYGRGWIFDAEIDPATLDRQLGGLMDAGAYRELTGA